jgi:hypothetical protein
LFSCWLRWIVEEPEDEYDLMSPTLLLYRRLQNG